MFYAGLRNRRFFADSDSDSKSALKNRLRLLLRLRLRAFVILILKAHVTLKINHFCDVFFILPYVSRLTYILHALELNALKAGSGAIARLVFRAYQFVRTRDHVKRSIIRLPKEETKFMNMTKPQRALRFRSRSR